MQNKAKPILLDEEQRRRQRLRQLRNWAILLGVIALVVVLTVFISGLSSSGGSIRATSLPCYSHQDVTVFQDGVLYYDGASIHFVNAGGGIEWSYPVGAGASFSVSDTHMIVWAGAQLSIVDAQGKSTFNRAMESSIQFARIGSRYAAIITGDELSPTLYVKDIQGAQVDFETNLYDGMYIFDCGFYGNSDEYLWTLSYDFYNPSVTTIMHTYQVGQMNTGAVNIGEHLPSKVIYVNNLLNVFTTQQLYTYDYRGVQQTDGTMLVYGWQYLDHYVPSRGAANILLVPTKQITDTGSVTELRVLSSTLDRRYALPSACVGAAIDNNRLFAIAPDYMYSGNVSSQRFYAHAIPLPDGRKVTGFVGLTNNGYAIVTSNTEVYSVSLPH